MVAMAAPAAEKTGRLVNSGGPGRRGPRASRGTPQWEGIEENRGLPLFFIAGPSWLVWRCHVLLPEPPHAPPTCDLRTR